MAIWMSSHSWHLLLDVFLDKRGDKDVEQVDHAHNQRHQPSGLKACLPLTRAKLLSIHTSKNQVRATTATARAMETGEFQMKNMPTHMRNRMLSHQCRISIFARVRPLISVVMPLTSSW